MLEFNYFTVRRSQGAFTEHFASIRLLFDQENTRIKPKHKSKLINKCSF